MEYVNSARCSSTLLYSKIRFPPLRPIHCLLSLLHEKKKEASTVCGRRYKAKSKKAFPREGWNANLGLEMISDWLPNGLIDGHTDIAYFRYLMYYFWRVLDFYYLYMKLYDMLPPIHSIRRTLWRGQVEEGTELALHQLYHSYQKAQKVFSTSGGPPDSSVGWISFDLDGSRRTYHICYKKRNWP